MIAKAKRNVNNRIVLLIALLTLFPIVFLFSKAIVFVKRFPIVSFLITKFELLLDLIFKHTLEGEQPTGIYGVLLIIFSPVLVERYWEGAVGRIVVDSALLERHDRLVDAELALEAANARVEVGDHQEAEARRKHPDKVLPQKRLFGLLAGDLREEN